MHASKAYLIVYNGTITSFAVILSAVVVVMFFLYIPVPGSWLQLFFLRLVTATFCAAIAACFWRVALIGWRIVNDKFANWQKIAYALFCGFSAGLLALVAFTAQQDQSHLKAYVGDEHASDFVTFGLLAIWNAVAMLAVLVQPHTENEKALAGKETPWLAKAFFTAYNGTLTSIATLLTFASVISIFMNAEDEPVSIRLRIVTTVGSGIASYVLWYASLLGWRIQEDAQFTRPEKYAYVLVSCIMAGIFAVLTALSNQQPDPKYPHELAIDLSVIAWPVAGAVCIAYYAVPTAVSTKLVLSDMLKA